MNLPHNKYFDKRNNCPICENKSFKNIIKIPFLKNEVYDFLYEYYYNKIPNEIIENTDYSVVKCLNCTSLFQEYILNDKQMFNLYENWISKSDSIDKKNKAKISMFTRYVNDLEKITKYFNKKPHEISILEYGMGWGFWSRIAQSLNFNITGFEISESRLDFVSSNNIKTINDIKKLQENKFDFIYSFAVFEHIAYPKKTLQLLSSLLNDGGLIYIYVPNGFNIEKKFKNKNWSASKDALHPLEHINCFNRKSLKILADGASMKIKNNIFLPRYKNKKSLITEILKHIYNNSFSTGVFLEKK